MTMSRVSGRYGRLDRIRTHRTVFEGKDSQPDPVLPFIFMERSQDRVVVECGREDVAVGLFSREKSLDEDVQGIGRIWVKTICSGGSASRKVESAPVPA